MGCVRFGQIYRFNTFSLPHPFAIRSKTCNFTCRTIYRMLLNIITAIIPASNPPARQRVRLDAEQIEHMCSIFIHRISPCKPFFVCKSCIVLMFLLKYLSINDARNLFFHARRQTLIDFSFFFISGFNILSNMKKLRWF